MSPEVLAMWHLDLPDFGFADDATLQQSLLSLDGRWSEQTRSLLAALGTTRLELNGNWASTPTDWRCPVCRRRKGEIARVTPAGVVLCQLDWHHDHLGDKGADILWRGQVKPSDRARHDAIASAVQACRGLGERFHTTLVCNDCNAADGAAKAALRGVIHPHFSFAPSEIALFIVVAFNRPHEIDIEAARTIWAEVAHDVADRLAFMETMALRIADGRHAREGSAYRPHPLPALVNDLLAASGLPWRNEMMLAAIHSRSIQRDGFGSSAKTTSRKRTAAPTSEDLARFTVGVNARDFWHAPPDDWRCDTCARSRFEMLRKSPKSGLWTAGAHRRRVFAAERRSDALWRRNGWYDSGPTFGHHHYVFICKDCRQIATDTKQTGQHLIDDCLSVQDIRDLLVAVRPHERPEFDREAAAQRAVQNFEIMAAIEDYDQHRQRCLGLFHGRRQLLHFHSEADVNKLQMEEIWEDHIEEAQRPAHLAWLLDEGRRYAQANIRDRWPPEEGPTRRDKMTDP